MAPSTRTQRQRLELVAEILQVARDQLEEGGPNAVSLRGVARTVGMSAPSLYTYFPSVAHLYTELIAQSYTALAGAISNALRKHANAEPPVRLVAGARAYRRWAIAHRQQFNLIFFDQISGYEAPRGGPTVEAQTMALRPIAASYAATLGCDLEELSADDALLDEFLAWWGAFHGIVALEVNHHLDWRDPERIFERHLARSVAHLDHQHHSSQTTRTTSRRKPTKGTM